MKKIELAERKTIVIKAFVVNALIFCILMLLFEPTAKNDEIHMSLYLIGAFDGKGGFTIWMTPIFDLCVRFFMWLTEYPYTLLIMEYIFVYLSFSLLYVFLSCTLLKRELRILMFVIFALAGYEFYIRLTFTKTAGVLAIAGYMILLYAIENGKLRKYSVLGFVLIFISTIVRISVSLLVTVLFGSAFLISMFQGLKNEQWKVKKNLLKKAMQYVICVLLIMAMRIGVSKMSTYIYDCSEWSKTYHANGYRSQLYDYGWAEYDKFKQEYMAMGISENDYVLWHDYHILSDSNILNKERMIQMHSLYDTDHVGENKIDLGIKNLLKYLFGEPMFIISSILLITVVTLGVKGKKYTGRVVAIYGTAIFAYFYLYNMGRTMHHVDVVIFFSVIVLLFYEIGADIEIKKEKWMHTIVQLVLTVCIFISFFYSWIGKNLVGSSAYCRVFNNDTEGQMKDMESFQLMSEDTKHFYAYIYIDYIYKHVFPVKRGFFHNIYEMNYTMDHVAHINQLENYGIDSVEAFWGEMLNSDMIYIRFSDETLAYLNVIEQYMKEHYSEEAKSYLVKRTDNASVFCFRDRSFDLSDKKMEINTDSVQVDYDVENLDDHITIEGYAFVNGDDSYSENVFVELTDQETGERRYFISTKMENKKSGELNKNTGKYGDFRCTIEESGINMEQNDLRIIIEKADGTYIAVEK